MRAIKRVWALKRRFAEQLTLGFEFRILLEDGAPEEALGVFEESLEIAKINHEESVQSAACYSCLGDVFSELEDYEVAEEN